MKNSFLLLVIFLLSCIGVVGQDTPPLELQTTTEPQPKQVSRQDLSPHLQKYFFVRLNQDDNGRVTLDTVSYLYNQYIGQLEYLNHDSVPARYIKSDPDYYKLFIPITYYRAAIEEFSTLDWEFDGVIKPKDYTSELLPFDSLQFTKFKRANETVNKSLLALYVNHPEYIEKCEDQIMGYEVQYDVVAAKKETLKTPITKLFEPESYDDKTKPKESPKLVIKKPNWWSTDGNGSLQFSQNYISENWHKGGESNKNLIGQIQLFLRYNDRKRVEYENIFEAKVGFNTISSDTVRKYRINTDLLRITTKLGIRATKRWYYTVSSEFNTQFFNNYKKNSKDKVSAFMAPANVSLNVGMDFKLNNKKVNLSAMFLPASYNLRYVGNKDIDETQFGLKKDRKTLHDIGSRVDIRFNWNIISSIRLNSRLFYFTNYEKVEAEWENTIDFVLNRYISAKIFAHARFDDGARRVKDRSYFQLKEMLSFGLNYRW